MVDVQDVRDKARSVCLPCRAGKRQCDKRLPTCSRCSRLNRVCQYATVTTHTPPAVDIMREDAPHTELSALELSSQSCIRCRLHKRKCDRLVPSCSRCAKLAFICQYEDIGKRSISISSHSERSALIRNPSREINSRHLYGPKIPFNPPVDYSPYMPMLLHFFKSSATLASDIGSANSLKRHLTSRWIATAMSDPCLFHATMFSAAASIDILMGRQTTPIALYHQTSTIRLLGERLSQEIPVLDYGTLGSVLPLIFYNMLAIDRVSAIVHQKGLIRMLLSISKASRDELGPLIGIIKMTMLSFSCIFDTPPLWDCLVSGPGRTHTILRSLVTSSMFKRIGSLLKPATVDSILDVYEVSSQLDHLAHADTATIIFEVDQVIAMAGEDKDIYTEVLEQPHTDNATRINACCQLTCLIFWKLLKNRSQLTLGTPLSITEEVNMLLDLMARIESSFWIRNAPEFFAWITFTGAAGCVHANDRGKFIHRGTSVLTAIDTDSLVLVTQGWKYFCLLRRISGLRLTSI